jgi:hypothetical protein
MRSGIGPLPDGTETAPVGSSGPLEDTETGADPVSH